MAHRGAEQRQRIRLIGRLADALAPTPQPHFLINIDTGQSLAVKSRAHTPIVFDDPERFQRLALPGARAVLDRVAAEPTGNPARDYLNRVAVGAVDASARIRQACQDYRTPVDYGIVPVQLDRVAACIAADLPTRLYYVAFRNNAFDTHVQQADLHQRLLTYVADAVHGFLADLERLGMAERVAVLMFSEFATPARTPTSAPITAPRT